MPTANNCSLKSENTVGSPAFSVCLAHTHTQLYFNDRLGPNMVPDLDTWEIDCSLKETQQIYGDFCLLKAYA